MGLNIKNEGTHALVRKLAARTGQSQTSAVEDAVLRRLEELERSDGGFETSRRQEVDRLLVELRHGLSDEDRRELRAAESSLYDEQGLPR